MNPVEPPHNNNNNNRITKKNVNDSAKKNIERVNTMRCLAIKE